MSLEQIMALVGFFIMLSGAMWRVWARVEGKVKVAEDKAEKAADRADKVAAHLAEHKLHVAETYVTKAGMQEQTSQIMKAIEGVGNRLDGRLDGLNDRLDRAFERTTR